MSASNGGSRPRLLDLFCGAGGAAVGYHRAGFEVVGVDIKPQPNYPFEFWQRDALAVLAESGIEDVQHTGRWISMQGFDAIHASPPCQRYTTMAFRDRGGRSNVANDRPDLIAPTRELLQATGLPWVIENVLGAKSEMRGAFQLTGEMFGLGVHRPRLFDTNWPWLSPPPMTRQPEPAGVYGKNDQRRLWTRVDGSIRLAATLEEGSEAMGIDWMTWDELREAIPPAYTEFIGTQLMAHLKATVAA